MCPGRRLARRLLESLGVLAIALSVSAAEPQASKPALAAPKASDAKAPVEKKDAKPIEPEPIVKWIEKRVGSKEKAGELLKEAIEEQDPMAIADLEDESDKKPDRRYTFFAVTLIPAWMSLTRETLTDYVVFKEIVPFIDAASYNEKTRILDLSGGVMGFVMHSFIRFSEKHERWVSFEIIAGSFRGMKGDLVFESIGEKGTVVMLTGELTGMSWPPAFVMEQGAQIALTVTAGKMRSYIIEKKRSLFEAKPSTAGKPKGKEKENDQELPQPRSRL